MGTKKTIKVDGARIESGIYARRAPDGRITSLQVKLKAAGSKVSICESFDNIDEARSYRDSVKADLALDPYKGRVLDARVEAHRKRKVMGVTVNDALAAYLAEVTPSKKSATTEKYVILRIQRFAIGRKPLICLRLESIRQFGQALQAEGVKPVTVAKHVSKLSAVLTWSRGKYDYPVPNPVLEMAAAERRTTGRTRERRVSEVEERHLRIQLANLPSKYMLSSFDLALETAARLGELVSFVWPDVDLENRIITLRDTKNGHDRPLLLSTRAVSVLQDLKKLPVQGLNRTVVRLHKQNHIQYWLLAKKRALEAYRQECLVCGAKPDSAFMVDLRWHDLRHEAISRIAERGALTNIHQMQIFSGHRDVRMLQRYTHIRTFGELAAKLG